MPISNVAPTSWRTISKHYLSVDFTGKMDAVEIAEAFGIRGVQITHPAQLIPVITDALASNEPVFIDVPAKSELGTASAGMAAVTEAGGMLVIIQMQDILFVVELVEMARCHSSECPPTLPTYSPRAVPVFQSVMRAGTICWLCSSATTRTPFP